MATTEESFSQKQDMWKETNQDDRRKCDERTKRDNCEKSPWERRLVWILHWSHFQTCQTNFLSVLKIVKKIWKLESYLDTKRYRSIIRMTRCNDQDRLGTKKTIQRRINPKPHGTMACWHARASFSTNGEHMYCSMNWWAWATYSRNKKKKLQCKKKEQKCRGFDWKKECLCITDMSQVKETIFLLESNEQERTSMPSNSFIIIPLAKLLRLHQGCNFPFTICQKIGKDTEVLYWQKECVCITNVKNGVFEVAKAKSAQYQDRTGDLSLSWGWDYETNALPTELTALHFQCVRTCLERNNKSHVDTLLVLVPYFAV